MPDHSTNPAEIWKPVPIEELAYSYEVSNLGRFRLRIRRSTSMPGRILKPDINAYGYHRIALFDAAGKKRRFSAHVLVARAFYGTCPEGKEINHINGIKTDNTISNLEYVSRSENIKHAIRIGLMKTQGEDHYHALLTNEQAQEVKKALAQFCGYGACARLAERYNVPLSTIQNIKNGLTYKHIKLNE